MQPLYVQKNLITGSSTGVGTISSAATPVVTLNATPVRFDTQRRLIVWSTAGTDISATTFTFVGTREGGGIIRESIIGSTGTTTSQTTLDFLTVTSMSASNVPATQATMGTNSVGSSPWKMINWHVNPINIGVSVITASSIPNYSVEYTYEDPTSVYPSVSTAAGPTVFALAALSAKTGTLDSNLITPVAAMRLTLNSGSSAGNTTMVLLQSGIGL
jgi:hypothetical protein